MIKEDKAHKSRSHWTLMKNSNIKNKHKNKYGKLKTIYQFGISSASNSQMKYERKPNTDYVHTKECNNGESNTGKLIIQW